MATHSSTLAWRIPWTEEPDGLQSIGSQELNAAEHKYSPKQTKSNVTLSINFTFQSPLSFNTHRNTEFIRERSFGFIL